MVRLDLSLPQQLVQAVHAAHEAGRSLAHGSDPPPHVVVCEVESEPDLLKVARRLDVRGIRKIIFREPDMQGQATALATEPISGRARNAMACYRLWKGI